MERKPENPSLPFFIRFILSGPCRVAFTSIREEAARIPHPVVHFEILGRDQKLLEEFYKGVFNWEITPVTEDYSLALIENKGGKTAYGPHHVPGGGIIGCFTHPEGHLIGLVQPPGM